MHCEFLIAIIALIASECSSFPGPPRAVIPEGFYRESSVFASAFASALNRQLSTASALAFAVFSFFQPFSASFSVSNLSITICAIRFSSAFICGSNICSCLQLAAVNPITSCPSLSIRFCFISLFSCAYFRFSLYLRHRLLSAFICGSKAVCLPP